MSGSSVPRATVDTNLFVSAALVLVGQPARLLRAWSSGQFVLVTAEPLIVEIESALRRPSIGRRLRMPAYDRERLLFALRTDAELVELLSAASLPLRCRDPKDDMLLACALGGRADYLVTGDDDLLVLAGDERLGGLRIVTVADFLSELERQA